VFPQPVQIRLGGSKVVIPEPEVKSLQSWNQIFGQLFANGNSTIEAKERKMFQQTELVHGDKQFRPFELGLCDHQSNGGTRLFPRKKHMNDLLMVEGTVKNGKLANIFHCPR